MAKRPGWYGESQRHALASKGVKTGQKDRKKAAKSAVEPQRRKSGKRELSMDPKEPLSERDLKTIMRRINNDPDADSDPAVRAFYDSDEGWKLTEEQQEKGKKWLMQTRVKKNMGGRELTALENMEEIRVIGTCPGQYNDYQYPLYRVIGGDRKFDYKVEGGEIHIVG